MPKRKRSKRRKSIARRGTRWFVTVLVFVVVVLGTWLAALWYWQASTLVQPPAIDVTTADPAVAKAVTAAREEVRQSPRSAAAWGKLAMVLFIHENFRDAEVCFQRAAELGSDEPRWPYLRGLSLFKGDARPQEAVGALRRAVELCGSEPTPRLRLGEALFEQGRLAEAEQLFRHVLQSSPQNPRAHLGLGRVHHARGDLDKAVTHLRISVQRAPMAKQTHALLAEIHFRLGNTAAENREREMLTRLPDGFRWPDPYFEAAREHFVGMWSDIEQANYIFSQGKKTEAIALLRQSISMNPDALMPHLVLAQLEVQVGEIQEAEKTLRQALRLSPDGVEVHFELAMVLQRQGRHDEAIEHFARAVKVKPNFALAHYHKGLSHLARHDLTGAREALQEAVRYQPDFTPAYKSLGRIFDEQGHTAEALKHLRLAVRLRPNDPEAKRLLEMVEAKAK